MREREDTFTANKGSRLTDFLTKAMKETLTEFIEICVNEALLRRDQKGRGEKNHREREMLV